MDTRMSRAKGWAVDWFRQRKGFRTCALRHLLISCMNALLTARCLKLRRVYAGTNIRGKAWFLGLFALWAVQCCNTEVLCHMHDICASKKGSGYGSIKVVSAFMAVLILCCAYPLTPFKLFLISGPASFVLVVSRISKQG